MSPAGSGPSLYDDRQFMMVKTYSGITVGVISVVAGIADRSAFLIVLGVIATLSFAGLALFFRRRRAEGYSVP